MPKPRDSDLQKHTLHLRQGDFARLGDLFPDMSASLALRTILSNLIDKVNAVHPSQSVPSDKEIDL